MRTILYKDAIANLEIATENLGSVCHDSAKQNGWWPAITSETRTPPLSRIGWALALSHSEVSEAVEGFRKDSPDDKLPHRKMAEVELADALIRICDLAGACGFNLGAAVVEKLVYNAERDDHKPENRAQAGGKKY